MGRRGFWSWCVLMCSVNLLDSFTTENHVTFTSRPHQTDPFHQKWFQTACLTYSNGSTLNGGCVLRSLNLKGTNRDVTKVCSHGKVKGGQRWRDKTSWFTQTPDCFLLTLMTCFYLFLAQRSHPSVCVPGGGSGCSVHVHEHRRRLHQLPVRPRSAPGLPGDAALHRSSAATRDGEPETGESASWRQTTTGDDDARRRQKTTTTTGDSFCYIVFVALLWCINGVFFSLESLLLWEIPSCFCELLIVFTFAMWIFSIG